MIFKLISSNITGITILVYPCHIVGNTRYTYAHGNNPQGRVKTVNPSEGLSFQQKQI